MWGVLEEMNVVELERGRKQGYGIRMLASTQYMSMPGARRNLALSPNRGGDKMVVTTALGDPLGKQRFTPRKWLQ